MKNIENIRLNGETYSLAPGFYDTSIHATTKTGNINVLDDLTNLSVKEVVKQMVAPDCVFPEFKIVNTDPYIFIGSDLTTETKTIVFCDEYENAPEEVKAEIETWSLSVEQSNILYEQQGTGDNFTKEIISQLGSIEGMQIGKVVVYFTITTKAITDINDVRYNKGKTSKTFKQRIDLTAIDGIVWYCTDSNNDPLTLDEIAQKYTNHEWQQELLFGRNQNFLVNFALNNSYLYFCIPNKEANCYLTLIDSAGHNVLTDANLLGKFRCSNEDIHVYCLGNQMLTTNDLTLKGIY